MFRPVIRLLAFFFKEINEVLRQPRLVLSLLLGPFLILLLFGAGYQGGRPDIRAILVVPANSGLQESTLKQVEGVISSNFKLVEVESDEQDALAQLHAGNVDLVQIFPENVEQHILKGEQSVVRFEYNEINPLNEQWIQYLGYAQVNELNKAILLQATQQMQQDAKQTKQKLDDFQARLDRIQNGGTDNPSDTKKSIEDLKAAVALMALNPLLTSQNGGDPEATRQQLQQLQKDLDDLEKANDQGTLKNNPSQIQSTREQIKLAQQALDKISALPPQVLVSPLQQQYQNTHGSALTFMNFYAPGVFALILQHIAVTLAALSLVHERLLGAIELFRVAPISMMQVLIGKYLGYIFFCALITAVLFGLMSVLQVPFLGSLLAFAGLMLLLVLASLGIGFLISSVSTSQSQAVQLSMLMLLLSIFFSGFFLPLENFLPAIRIVGYVLPLTHGVVGLQDIMLRGFPPGLFQWVALSLIALVSFVLVTLITQRQFRQSFSA